MSIFNHIVEIYCWNVRCNQKLRKKSPKPLFGGFKVVQCHRCWQI